MKKFLTQGTFWYSWSKIENTNSLENFSANSMNSSKNMPSGYSVKISSQIMSICLASNQRCFYCCINS